MHSIKVFTLLHVVIQVNYGFPCVPDFQISRRRFYLQRKTINSSINRKSNSIFHQKTKLSTGNRKLFNPLKHKNWPLIFDEDCGMSSANRIIGGIDADLGQFPWIGRIGYVKSDEPEKPPIFQCGASLISKFYVITAAHCVTNLPADLIASTVRFGEYNTETEIDCVNDICASPAVDYKMKNILVHKDYSNPQNGHDIALIQLQKPVEFTVWISPICLPYGPLVKKKFINETAEVAGWGFYQLGLAMGHSILQTVKLPILDHVLCDEVYKTTNTSKVGQMCVGGEIGKDSCNGDSGGPLMKVQAVNGIPRYYLLGIVSFGAKFCGLTSTPAIYTRVSNYLKWVLDNIEFIHT